MKIAHVLAGRCNPESANGIDKMVFNVTRMQARRGNRVGIWGVTDKPPIPIDGVEVHSIGHARLPVVTPPGLVSALQAWRPDIVHLHFVFSPPCTALGRQLAKHNIPYVVSPHGGLAPNAIRQRPVRKRAFALLFENRHLEHAARLHAVCHGETIDIRNFGISTTSFVAPHGVDDESIPEVIDRNRLANEFSVVRNKRVFMYFGRLANWQKGLDLLVDAVSLLGDRASNNIFVMVGPDWRGNQERLESQIRRTGTSDKFVFTGPRFGQEKWDLIAGADVMLLPSRWDVMPTGLLEAMSLNKPAIVTEATNLGNEIHIAQAGLVVEPEPAALATGITQFGTMESSELRTWGENAGRMIKNEFRWSNTAQLIEENYSLVLSHHSGTTRT